MTISKDMTRVVQEQGPNPNPKELMPINHGPTGLYGDWLMLNRGKRNSKSHPKNLGGT